MTVLLEYLDGEEILQRWDASIICLSLMTAWTGTSANLTITDHLKFCTDRFWYVVFIILAGLSIGVNTVWCSNNNNNNNKNNNNSNNNINSSNSSNNSSINRSQFWSSTMWECRHFTSMEARLRALEVP
ncbi:unnamed protein product [Polarella glacialis]|uniref:Uncharacterized protein n=1 Tax=Polarella glacialis TaxID=89957 RepID=A0A813ICJ0_POLGL|nr:unnamed protein product [Polarella glacialis]